MHFNKSVFIHSLGLGHNNIIVVIKWVVMFMRALDSPKIVFKFIKQSINKTKNNHNEHRNDIFSSSSSSSNLFCQTNHRQNEQPHLYFHWSSVLLCVAYHNGWFKVNVSYQTDFAFISLFIHFPSLSNISRSLSCIALSNIMSLTTKHSPAFVVKTGWMCKCNDW